jgi:hypothetical protein
MFTPLALVCDPSLAPFNGTPLRARPLAPVVEGGDLIPSVGTLNQGLPMRRLLATQGTTPDPPHGHTKGRHVARRDNTSQ